jgi:hypothetical protein
LRIAIKALRIKEINRKNYNEPKSKLGINAYDGGREQAINRSVCKANDGRTRQACEIGWMPSIICSSRFGFDRTGNYARARPLLRHWRRHGIGNAARGAGAASA